MTGSSEEGNGERTQQTSLWPFLLFGTIGATAYGVSQVRQKVAWFGSQDKAICRKNPYGELNRSPLYAFWRSNMDGFGYKSFREETLKRHSSRMQEEYEDEMERLERIRKMQSVFHRVRNKSKASPQSWRHDGPGAYQHFQRDDWYWKTDTSYKDQKKHSGAACRQHGVYLLSHHYSILGLDRFRTTPYTDAEIKIAFRAKAKEYHPDQNQFNKAAAEAKFKEVMMSYEAIKLERKNGK